MKLYNKKNLYQCNGFMLHNFTHLPQESTLYWLRWRLNLCTCLCLLLGFKRLFLLRLICTPTLFKILTKRQCVVVLTVYVWAATIRCLKDLIRLLSKAIKCQLSGNKRCVFQICISDSRSKS